MPADQPPRKIQSPRGTRDLYPAEAARRRWLTERWREVSVRHGFEEVDGPTFEESDLYAVKSGDGILGELFQAFSGKSPDEVEQVKQTGRAPYALRPEFTPTLARMYAAKAAGLPKPCKWFMAGPFFRAERPQRGRLREFLQWNADILGLDIPPEKWYAEDAESKAELAEAKARMDAEAIACCVSFLELVGLTSTDVEVCFNSRAALEALLKEADTPASALPSVYALLDSYGKDNETWLDRLAAINLPTRASERVQQIVSGIVLEDFRNSETAWGEYETTLGVHMKPLIRHLDALGLQEWVGFYPHIARGLAYYTGTVFEVIAEGERAVAGGGRYDNLIQLFGGPPTPAVGFAMGDVVLSLLLQDKGLMPSDEDLMRLPGQHPDVFVLSEPDDDAHARIRPTVAALRRAGLHARHSYKATRKPDKLLNEAKKQGAPLAAIIQPDGSCLVRDLRSNQDWPDRIPITDLHRRLRDAL